MTLTSRINSILSRVAVGETVGISTAMGLLNCKRPAAVETLLVMEARGILEADDRVYRRIK